MDKKENLQRLNRQIREMNSKPKSKKADNSDLAIHGKEMQMHQSAEQNYGFDYLMKCVN